MGKHGFIVAMTLILCITVYLSLSTLTFFYYRGVL